MARAAHRLRQFFGALRPRVAPRARYDAYAWLDEPQRRIFASMAVRDQQHGIDVFRRVRAAAGADDPHLFAAALLHDCGKGRVQLWQRVAHVLLGAVAPPLRARIASEQGAPWRRALWRLLHHPEIGAAIVARAGGDADVVRMIREQEATQPDARVALLQAADEA
ncbi:MAG: HD domain-containing protein [Chloroflexota bacterium]|nr:HD domain-containing protein [Chloroflexota bacterium]